MAKETYAKATTVEKSFDNVRKDMLILKICGIGLAVAIGILAYLTL